jgi:hypothetical protein
MVPMGEQKNPAENKNNPPYTVQYNRCPKVGVKLFTLLTFFWKIQQTIKRLLVIEKWRGFFFNCIQVGVQLEASVTIPLIVNGLNKMISATP